MDDYESLQGVGTSKEGLEAMINIQPKDPSNGHFYISIVKSIVRIGAGTCLLLTDDPILRMAGLFFIVAEILGVLEEVV